MNPDLPPRPARRAVAPQGARRPCERCGSSGPTRAYSFHQNIGALVRRFSKNYQGWLCFSCASSTFWSFTLVTLVVGWWGMISLFVAPAFIVMNILSYTMATDERGRSGAGKYALFALGFLLVGGLSWVVIARSRVGGEARNAEFPRRATPEPVEPKKLSAARKAVERLEKESDADAARFARMLLTQAETARKPGLQVQFEGLNLIKDEPEGEPPARVPGIPRTLRFGDSFDAEIRHSIESEAMQSIDRTVSELLGSRLVPCTRSDPESSRPNLRFTYRIKRSGKVYVSSPGGFRMLEKEERNDSFDALMGISIEFELQASPTGGGQSTVVFSGIVEPGSPLKTPDPPAIHPTARIAYPRLIEATFDRFLSSLARRLVRR